MIYSCVLNVCTDIASPSFDHHFATPDKPCVLIHSVVMALPLAMLRRLQMGWKVKLGLAGIFCCAFVTIAFDILRSVETLTDGDRLGLTALWTNLESAVAVLVSCLPSLKVVPGPRRKGHSTENVTPYGQRSWPLSDTVKVYRPLGESSRSGIESLGTADRSFNNSSRGSTIDVHA